MTREGRSVSTPVRPVTQDGPVVTQVWPSHADLSSRRFTSAARQDAPPPTRRSAKRSKRRSALRVIDGTAAPTATVIPLRRRSRPFLYVVSADSAEISPEFVPAQPQPPWRPRAALVPLGDDVTAHTSTGPDNEPWFLSTMGTEAHRPAPGSHYASRSAHRSFPPERTACGVFLTQVLAGPDVTRCELCRQTAPPADSIPPGGHMR